MEPGSKGYVQEAERRSDQTHIVILGKPTHDDGRRIGVQSGDDDVHVAVKVGNGDHDAFREGSASGSVLKEAEG